MFFVHVKNFDLIYLAHVMAFLENVFPKCSFFHSVTMLQFIFLLCFFAPETRFFWSSSSIFHFLGACATPRGSCLAMICNHHICFIWSIRHSFPVILVFHITRSLASRPPATHFASLSHAFPLLLPLHFSLPPSLLLMPTPLRLSLFLSSPPFPQLPWGGGGRRISNRCLCGCPADSPAAWGRCAVSEIVPLPHFPGWWFSSSVCRGRGSCGGACGPR